jgi:class 3 adenylate cyclase
MRSDLPSGTVTFLFTDVEGSTRLLEELGDEAYEEALLEHRPATDTGALRPGVVSVPPCRSPNSPFARVS